MIVRVLFPTPLHQFLTILAVILLASTSTFVYLTKEGLKNQEISPFGEGTFYAEYFYYEGFNTSKKEIWKERIHRVSEKFPYIRIGEIFVLNSTKAIVSIDNHSIPLKPTQIMITDENIYNVSSFRFVKKNANEEGIILGYEIYRALKEMGKVRALRITLKNNGSTIFTYGSNIIGILSPTPSDTLNAGIIVVKRDLENLQAMFPKITVFKVPPEYREYIYALAQNIDDRGLPVVPPEKSSSSMAFQTMLNLAVVFTDIGLFFIIAAYVMVSKRIWLKELVMAILSGAGLFKVLSWLFLRNIITVLAGIILGTFIGDSLFTKTVKLLPPTYYFYFTNPGSDLNVLFLNLVIPSVIVFVVTLWVHRYVRKSKPMKIIKEVFYQ